MTENVDTSQLRRKGGLASTATALLGIDRNVLRPRFFEKDEYQGVAGLGHRIAALAGYLSGHAACILRNDLAEAIALDGNLLSGLDLFVEFDQMLASRPLPGLALSRIRSHHVRTGMLAKRIWRSAAPCQHALVNSNLNSAECSSAPFCLPVLLTRSTSQAQNCLQPFLTLFAFWLRSRVLSTDAVAGQFSASSRYMLRVR